MPPAAQPGVVPRLPPLAPLRVPAAPLVPSTQSAWAKEPSLRELKRLNPDPREERRDALLVVHRVMHRVRQHVRRRGQVPRYPHAVHVRPRQRDGSLGDTSGGRLSVVPRHLLLGREPSGRARVPAYPDASQAEAPLVLGVLVVDPAAGSEPAERTELPAPLAVKGGSHRGFIPARAALCSAARSPRGHDTFPPRVSHVHVRLVVTHRGASLKHRDRERGVIRVKILPSEPRHLFAEEPPRVGSRGFAALLGEYRVAHQRLPRVGRCGRD